MIPKLITISLIILLGTITSLIAQKAPFKFGKVDEDEVLMKEYSLDTEAEAVILGDFGESKFIYSDDRGFQIEFTREVRVKIFNKNAYSQADIAIPFYDAGGYGKEEVSFIKGFTYNLESGKVVKNKLEKDAIFEEQISENWFRVKFTLPNVQEGSVLEYSYKVTSDYFQNLRGWEFQKEIPVVLSEYRVTIPEYYDYRLISQGNHPYTIRDDKIVQEKFTYTYNTSPGRALSTGTGEINSSSKAFRWLAEKVPAIKKEPFMTTVQDYSNQIGFQLIGKRFPNQPFENLAVSYQSFNQTMLDREAFGKRLERNSFIQEFIDVLISEDQLATAVNLYEYVRKNINWNDRYGVFPQQPLRKTYEDKIGNSADINMLLVAMLRSAGIEAHPVILSLRNNGKPHPQFPTLERFNYTIAAAKVDGQIYLGDASAKKYPFNSLPEKCLNGRGWMITDGGGEWIDLQNNAYKESSYKIKLTLREDGTIAGTVNIENKGHEAVEVRSSINKNGQEDYITGLESRLGEWSFDNTTIENLESLYNPLVENYELTTSSESMAGIIYLNPFITGSIIENPFKKESRNFPVDMETRLIRQHLIEIQIPQGYMVEELPESAVISLPENAGNFQLRTSAYGNKISVLSIVKIEKLYYLPGDYTGLKQFFDLIIAKQAEQIVLKKST